MYVIEPRVRSINLYWQDASKYVQRAALTEIASPVDIQQFPGFPESGEVVLILPTGLDILTRKMTKLDADVLNQLSECARRLPEYDQTAYEIARQLISRFPNIPAHVLCNSAFFTELPLYERSYALDPHLFRSAYQRYGGDGLCHFGALSAIQEQIGQDKKIISVHLCDLPSLTAWQGNAIVNSSMGYSPLEGMLSADGCGSIDPGIPLMLAEGGLTSREIRHSLARDSGWNALIGQRVGIDDLCDSSRLDNATACNILLDQVIEQIGSACSAMGGLDAIVFSLVSIDGPNQMMTRVISRLGWLGCKPSAKPVSVDGWLLLNGENSSIQLMALEYSPLEIIQKFL